MGIIDPSIIAFMQNHRQAQDGSGYKASETIGAALVDSLRRISLFGPVREAETVCG
ncbi:MULTISPECIES: hypothetical protein [Paracoccus]|uniref:hypothetical protein n=1 Tax=Paracoccus TaxID=265 RepID=UPI0013EF3880|nr:MULTISPECIES: hypothetical protein [Paracoccus]MBY0138628.1 hypothetical protein [Paracoccus yeei]